MSEKNKLSKFIPKNKRETGFVVGGAAVGASAFGVVCGILKLLGKKSKK